MAQRPPRLSRAAIWAVPTCLAVVTGLGLFLALTGNGGIDWIANAGLAIPVVVAFVTIVQARD